MDVMGLDHSAIMARVRFYFNLLCRLIRKIIVWPSGIPKVIVSLSPVTGSNSVPDTLWYIRQRETTAYNLL